jgi:class 3 adenylate cyclase
MSLRPSGIGRFVHAAFLSVWLAGWVVGETFALGMLAAILGWMTGLLSEPRPAWVLDLVAGSGAAFAFLFLVLWLTLWTVGGIAALTQLTRSLVGVDHVGLTDNGFEVVRRAGPLRRRYAFDRSHVRRLRLRPRDHAVVVDTTAGTRVVTTFGLPSDRDQLAERLRQHLALPDGDSGPGALPSTWELRTEGDAASVRKVRPRVRWVRSMIAWLLAAVVAIAWYQSIRMDAGSAGLPALALALLLTVGAAFSTWGRREWIARPGELTFHRSFATWVSERTFRSARLEVTHDTDSDGDSHYKLVVTDADGRSTLHSQVHDSGEVVDLARWVAGRTGFPLKSFDVLLTDRWPPARNTVARTSGSD